MATVQREKYQRLIDACKSLPPTPTAVAHPCDASSLEGAMAAARMGLIVPFLVGPRERILAVAAASGHRPGRRRDRRRAAQRRRRGPRRCSWCARARPRR